MAVVEEIRPTSETLLTDAARSASRQHGPDHPLALLFSAAS